MLAESLGGGESLGDDIAGCAAQLADAADDRLPHVVPRASAAERLYRSAAANPVRASTLVEVLRCQNGGYLRRWVFPTDVKNYSAEGFVPVDYLGGISRDEDAANSLLCTAYMTHEWGLPDGLVLLCGDGHTWIAIDYRHPGAEPGVTFIDAEMEQEIRLSPSFSEFVARLTEEEPAG